MYKLAEETGLYSLKVLSVWWQTNNMNQLWPAYIYFFCPSQCLKIWIQVNIFKHFSWKSKFLNSLEKCALVFLRALIGKSWKANAFFIWGMRLPCHHILQPETCLRSHSWEMTEPGLKPGSLVPGPPLKTSMHFRPSVWFILSLIIWNTTIIICFICNT